MPKIAVIGAGMAGLTCARALGDHGLRPVIFDKGRGLGGRMATRRAEGGFQFDHGAQYLTARSRGFAEMLAGAEAAGALALWPEPRERPAYVGIPGMTGLAKHIGEELDIRKATRIQRIVPEDGHWRLDWQDGSERFDRLVITAPAPQTAALLPEDHDFAEALHSVGMDPCLTLMVGLPTGADLPFVTRRAPEEDISWIACDSAKPGRPDGPCVVAQAGRGWSLRHLELELDAIAERMLPLVREIIGKGATVDPPYLSAHRWRYGLVTSPLGQPYLRDGAKTLFAGGDWCLGAKAEDAWTSGRAIADALIDGL
ncbi:FAD-binding protein [Thalassococcus profundi]|uniref:FAD-binding protein n=1 Tax=Thalassococcus profundi TaxID=2282382 RepID=A0A369TMG0_9RHOB|nr:FAD-dependent oxidoreductase [Thalassococcus profundi]RDD65625.1 FAD-binding protein [Thalassococcus profundi]